MMQFDYIETMVSLSPLDFNYEYGKVNNNSPDKFRINNCTIVTKEFSQPFRSRYKIDNSLNFLYNTMTELEDNNAIFDEDESYDIQFFPEDALYSHGNGVWLKKEDKVTDTSQFTLETTTIEGILVSTFSTGFGAFNSLTSSSSNGDTMAGDITALVMNIINLGVNIYNLWATIQRGKERLAQVREMVRLRVEELNERIAENEAFIKQAQEKINQRNLKSISVT